MNLIILGPQASGKGTQAGLLSEKFNLAHIEMSRVLKNLTKEDNPLGEKIKNCIVQGNLVPDEIINEVLTHHLQGIRRIEGLIFDGFPRIVSQAVYLENFLEQQDRKIDLVIYLVLARDETLRRLAGRRTCEKCQATYNTITKPPQVEGICDKCKGKLIIREDETPQAIENRLNIFEQQTKPVIEFYDQKGILEKVEGNRPIETIGSDIVSRLEKRGLINCG